jgi:hypothetical protein
MSAREEDLDDKEPVDRVVAHVAAELVRHRGIAPLAPKEMEALKTLDRDVFESDIELRIQRAVSDSAAQQ